jgi:hypothetical protein
MGFLYVVLGPASYGGDCMASFNAAARACEVQQADEDLAYEVGPVHDYFWHHGQARQDRNVHRLPAAASPVPD